MKVWIGIYEHKYGVDAVAYASEQLALEGLASTAMQQLEDDATFDEECMSPGIDDEAIATVTGMRLAYAEQRWSDVIGSYIHLANEWGMLSESMEIIQSEMVGL